MGTKKGVVTVAVMFFLLFVGSISIQAQGTADGLHAGVSMAFGSQISSLVTASKDAKDTFSTASALETVSAILGYENIGIAVTGGSNLNVREEPNESASLVGKLPNNAACEIISETEDGWYEITSANVSGYVKGDYLLTGDEALEKALEVMETVVVVTSSSVRLRTEPNTDSTIITSVPQGEELEFVEDLGDWYKVELDGDECYVSAEYTTLTQKISEGLTMSEIRYGEGVSDVRVALVNYALQFVGNPYKWGGTSLTNGVDCSGFTMKVYEKFGITLPHYSAAQAKCGTKIKASQAQPGDLFFYSSGGTISHVAIYIGNGKIVHASSPKTGIKISSAYYRTPTCVVRILDD